LYLRQSGWEAGMEILPYQKYMVLKRFVSSLLRIGDEESQMTMKKYSSEVSMEKLRKVFEGITTVDYCDLAYKGGDSYHVYVFCLHPSEWPLLTTVKLKFNAKNRIEVEECGKKHFSWSLQKTGKLSSSPREGQIDAFIQGTEINIEDLCT